MAIKVTGTTVINDSRNIENITTINGTSWATVVSGASGRPTLDEVTDVTIASASNGDLLKYNSTSGEWENTTLSFAEITGTLQDADIVASNVTQHQAALSITESQISDLGTYETADATILKDADIGVNVEAYDATILKDADIGVTVQAYGAYEAADSTILKDADIGVNVEAYDATILKDADIGLNVQAYNSDYVVDATYVKTDQNFTTSDHNKLDGIEAGATADQTKVDIEALGIAFSSLSVIPTTVSGYGITDAYTSTEADAAIATAIGDLVDSAPAALDTLNELAASLGDDADFAGSMTTNLATKLPLAGGALTGALTTTSTIAGRDVATDGTKLDTVETNADVTDTANVTAAGAVMDSEVTNLAAVKAFDPADYQVAGSYEAADSTILKDADIGVTVQAFGSYEAADSTILKDADIGVTVQAYGAYEAADSTILKDADIGVNVEAYDATILKDADIGVNVQAYDANIVSDANYVATANNFTTALMNRLNNIEAGADVTDALNVTQAGALMDSEVTNLADVKAFDTADYATAAQGTTADAALPKAGGTMTGDIQFGSNGKVKLGTNALSLYSTGLNSLIYNNSGGLYFYQATDDGNIHFQSDDSTGGTTDYILAEGSTGEVQLNHYGTTKVATKSTGIDVTGNIAVSGTVDGRDVAADGTKLDGIETGATADMTGAEIQAAYEIQGNAWNNTLNAKLGGIEENATADQTKADIEGLGIELPAANLTGTIAAARLDTAVTQLETDDSTKIATTAFVTDKIETLIGGAPGTLNDLNELAAAINDDANYNTTLTTALATKLPLAGGALTGAVTTNSTFDGRDVAADGTKLDTIATSANNYVHPSYDGDDAAVDTGPLTGATVISDLDFNITTDASGHVTDANATVATRSLTLGDLGYTGETNATADQTDAEIRAAVEAATDSNVFTDADHTKLNGIATGATNVTNNNQLTNGAGYITSYVDTTYTAGGGLGLSGTNFSVASDQRGQIQYIGLDSNDYFAVDTTTMNWYLDGNLDMRLENDGDLHVDGNVVAYSTTTSDERLKKDIVKIDNALDKVSQLNGYTFEYLNDGKKSAGILAQEVEAVLPSAVSEMKLPLKSDDDQEYKVVQYDQLHGLLIEAIKELKAEIETLKG